MNAREKEHLEAEQRKKDRLEAKPRQPEEKKPLEAKQYELEEK